MQVGLAASTFYNMPDPTHNNFSPDLLVAPWAACGDGGTRTRHNMTGCRVGTIRYNPAKNTLCVAANIGEYDHHYNGKPPVGRVYEFALPDWPIDYYDAGNAPQPGLIGEPIPVSDPDWVRLVPSFPLAPWVSMATTVPMLVPTRFSSLCAA